MPATKMLSLCLDRWRSINSVSPTARLSYIEVDMLRKFAKKTFARSAPRSGELTCSEGQVEEMLSVGESTEEEERISPPKPSEQKTLPARK